jgi:hypothetical protein
MKKPIIALLCLLLVLLSGCFGDIRVQVPSDADVIYEESSAEVTLVSSETESVSFSLPQIPSAEVFPSSSSTSRRSPAAGDESSGEPVKINPDALKWLKLYKGEFETRDDLCFALFDIDKNGVPELFVNNGYDPNKETKITFTKLYTVKDGKIVFVGELKFHWIGYIEVDEGIIFYPENAERTISSFACKYDDGNLTYMNDYIHAYYDEAGNYVYRLGERIYEREEDGHIPSAGLYRICFYDFDVELLHYSLPPHYDR